MRAIARAHIDRADPHGRYPAYLWVRWLYLRILGFGYVAAFLSLWPQIEGLVGPRGILPAESYLGALAEHKPALAAFVAAPTLLWIDAGPFALDVLCGVGLAAGVLLLVGVWPRLGLAVAFLSYLSFVAAAQDFSRFQSDGLMLETTVLAFFAAPACVRPGLGRDHPPSQLAIFMLRWLCFRLMFEPGFAKIASGDEGWRTLTALDAYWENCPFPTVLGWWAQQLPHGFHRAAALYTLVVELALAPLILIGRRPRMFAGVAWIALQLGILVTGNYTFLNYNAIALGLWLLDDAALARVARRSAPEPMRAPLRPTWRRVVTGCTMGLLLYVTTFELLWMLRLPVRNLPGLFTAPVLLVDELRVANRYALFAVMTQARDHVELEGSDDGGATWRTYRFRWQPQELEGSPRFMAPHLPRFDWNLWFATLDPWQEHPLVLYTAVRLMENEQAVIALFAEAPFPGRPPDRIRFPLWRYRFTDPVRLRDTGAWWSRERIGWYAPMVLRDDETGKYRLEPLE